MKLVGVFLLFCISTTCCFAQDELKKDSKYVKSIERGALIYEDFCVTCHLPSGKGVEKMIPPLAKSDFLMQKTNKSLKAIKFGQKGKIIVNGITYNSVMAPLGLTDDEIADVMNYITTSWGNKNNKMITVEEVSKIEQ